MGVFVAGETVGSGSASGVDVGSTVGVGYPMNMISKAVFRAPLSKVSRETDLKPFIKNSIG